MSLHFFETHERKETGREGEGSVYSVQETGVIEAKPEVKIQSASTAPGIATAPRSVVQVPRPDDGSTVSGGVFRQHIAVTGCRRTRRCSACWEKELLLCCISSLFQ